MRCHRRVQPCESGFEAAHDFALLGGLIERDRQPLEVSDVDAGVSHSFNGGSKPRLTLRSRKHLSQIFRLDRRKDRNYGDFARDVPTADLGRSHSDSAKRAAHADNHFAATENSSGIFVGYLRADAFRSIGEQPKRLQVARANARHSV